MLQLADCIVELAVNLLKDNAQDVKQIRKRNGAKFDHVI